MHEPLENVLKALEPHGVAVYGQENWDVVVSEVLAAGGVADVSLGSRRVLEGAMRKAEFASRSEAARYAANMRWRGSNSGGLAQAQADARAKAGAPKMPKEDAPAVTSDTGTGVNDPEYDAPEYKAKLKEMANGRLYEIVTEIEKMYGLQDKKIPKSAKPYLDAMSQLSKISDRYYEDTGTMVVAYAVSNVRFFGKMGKAIKSVLMAEIKR